MNRRVEAEAKRKRSPYIALIGLGIAVVVGIIAWLIAPPVLDALARALPGFSGNELPLSTSRPLFTGILVLLALIVFGLVAALITPKDDHATTEAHMEREREQLRRRQKAERAQRRKP